MVPESYLAPKDVRQIRERTRYRMALSALRTAMKNRIQAILHRLGILHTFSDLFGKGGRKFLEQLQLPQASRAVLVSCLELLDEVIRHIQAVEKRNYWFADKPRNVPRATLGLSHIGHKLMKVRTVDALSRKNNRPAS
jgi:hypothetical protein